MRRGSVQKWSDRERNEAEVRRKKERAPIQESWRKEEEGSLDVVGRVSRYVDRIKVDVGNMLAPYFPFEPQTQHH